MNLVVIANVISLMGACLLVVCGCLKKRRKTFAFQNGQMILFIIANILLNAYAGIVTNAVSILRNVFCMLGKFNWIVKIFINLCFIGFNLCFNNHGMIGWLPVISGIFYSSFMDVKDERTFKIIIGLSEFPWIIYDCYIMNYVSVVIEVVSIISCTIGYFRVRKDMQIREEICEEMRSV